MYILSFSLNKMFIICFRWVAWCVHPKGTHTVLFPVTLIPVAACKASLRVQSERSERLRELTPAARRRSERLRELTPAARRRSE